MGREIRARARPADPGDVRRRRRGELKALIVFGEDIAQTDPDSGHVEAALEACELVVSQEIFLSRDRRAGRRGAAGGRLPGEGRHLHELRPPRPAGAPGARPPPARRAPTSRSSAPRRAPWAPISDARRRRMRWTRWPRWRRPFAGISHERLDREGPIAWPCRAPPTRASGGSTVSASRRRAARRSWRRSPTPPPARSPTPTSRSCS